MSKIILITGASSGIGKSISLFLTYKGFKVYGTCRDPKKYNISEFELLKCDINSQIEIQNTVKHILEIENRIDVLINNAGITGSTSSLWNYDVVEWNKIIEINLMGTFNCCKCVVPYMIKNDYGRIVNVASVAGKDGNANASAYS